MQLTGYNEGVAFLFFFAVLCFGLAMLWGVRAHQERMIAQQGYQYYVRYSKRWKAKAKACKKRYGYRCAFCNSPHNLETHHRTYARLYRERQEDLVCLCDECHGILSAHQKLYKG